MTQALVKGSLAQVARASQTPVAELYLDLKAVLIVDVSLSMNDSDAREGQRRVDVAQQELAKIQAELPGQIAIVAFSSDHSLCPTGILPEPHGGTNLAAALKYVKKFDDLGIRFVVICDGEVDSGSETLIAAKSLHSRLDTIYVGPETGKGREFLKRLANTRGGQSCATLGAKELASSTVKLLTS